MATTRPETMLGDTAVAVHPDDERYKAHDRQEGHRCRCSDGEIPIIADDACRSRVRHRRGEDHARRTTPTTSRSGQRHNLPQISVIGCRRQDERRSRRLRGLDRFEGARADRRRSRGAGSAREDRAARARRSATATAASTVVEPMLSTQWFVKIEPLAEPAHRRGAATARTQFVPEHWEKTYFEWMENIRDWCISRQLWWGHQIPAWYCDHCGDGDPSARDDRAPSRAPKCRQCGEPSSRQDNDVLDTWFSLGRSGRSRRWAGPRRRRS